MGNNVIVNKEAEEALIGSVLINPDALYEKEVAELRQDDFCIHWHQEIWQAFMEMQEEGEPVNDITLLSEKMSNADVPRLLKLSSNVPSSLNSNHYARIVQDKAIRRETVQQANELAVSAYNEDADITEARAGLALALSTTRETTGAVHISEWLSYGLDLLEEWSENPSEHAGLSTGFGDLDKVFGDGIMPGLNLLLGPPGMGKSILAQSIGTHWVRNGIPTAFYAGEMHKRDMFLRLISDASEQKVSDLRKGNIDFEGIIQAAEGLEKTPFYVDDPKSMTTSGLRADLTRLKTQYGIRGVIFDFLTDLCDYGNKYEKEWERAEKIAVRTQRMLKNLDMHGLFVHELTKSGWDDMKMGSISGGRKVAYRAVCAVSLSEHLPPKGEKPNDDWRTVIQIKKPRHVEGSRGACNLYKDPHFPRFSQTINYV